ncbi:F0F1 ATP synthase subunit epsilon [Geminicoccaceae bacterium 1502E]|nr:F0F1 ATP synthase subunit epsilon [Geminicoccaceae bacterium 1502E]
MADNTLRFELVAPERLLASEEVDMVVLPGSEGDFGVLPQHAPFLSLLRPGIIGIYRGDKLERRIFVAGGFAEVNGQGCIVLGEAAEPVDELDAEKARQALKNAEEDLADAKEPSESERERLERAIRVAQARLEAAEAA